MMPASSRLSRFHGLDARIKLAALAVALITCVSTPPDRFFAFAGYFALLAAGMVLARISPRTAGRRLLMILPFVAMASVFIPFLDPNAASGGYSLGLGGLRVTRSGLLVLWNIVAKSCLGVLFTTLLIETTPFPDLLQALERLRFPRLAILLTSFAYRYGFVLAEEARRMKRARDARCYGGRWLWQAGVIGRMIGTLFLRGYERGERVYIAMVSRGFDGRVRLGEASALNRTDYLFLAGTSVLFLALRAGAL